jgi:diaminopimelate decarboxylase
MTLSWLSLRNLEEEYGDSFFILDLRQFETNYEEFLQGFRSIYPNTNLGYSYKTNYIPKLCHIVHSLGGYAEVVSQMEYDLAISIGVPPNRIIFNGPLKHQEDLEKAILAGSIVNLDCLEEVEIVAGLAERIPAQKIAVGLRCNFDIGTNRISRFGFDVTTGELNRAFERLTTLNNCTVIGLHCHISTSARSAESYAIRTQKILELTDHYFPDKPPKFIDIGGGFYGKMTNDLKSQFDSYIPTYKEYAAAVAPQLRGRYPDNFTPELIIEPGVAIVSDVLKYVAKVVGLKRVRTRQLALVVGSVHNVKPTMNDTNLSLQIFRTEENISRRKLAGPVDIVGYTCMEHDCLYKDYPGEIGVEDYVVFGNMGSYTVVFKPPFILPNPPIISYDSITDEYTLIRRRETSQDVFSTYIL